MKRTSVVPRIIAIGGGAFEPDNVALSRYILARARRRTPSVCYIPTASGDADSAIARFYAAFARLRCRPSHVTLFTRTPDLAAILPAQDVIFVGGGNTKSMLAAWREWQVPRIFGRAWRSGTVLAGASAGAICWFRVGITDSWADRIASLPCLGWLPGACCPHYDGEAERRPSVHRLVAETRGASRARSRRWRGGVLRGAPSGTPSARARRRALTTYISGVGVSSRPPCRWCVCDHEVERGARA